MTQSECSDLKATLKWRIVRISKLSSEINPYPANMENMMSSS